MIQCDVCNKRQPTRGIDGCFYELRDSTSVMWQIQMRTFGCERFDPNTAVQNECPTD